MSDPISISKTLSIRNCGYDEYWLPDQVFANPAILKLGDAELGSREIRHSSRGKLAPLLMARSGSKLLVRFWVNGSDFDEVWAAFDQKGLPATRKKASKGTTESVLTVDQNLVEANADLFQRGADFVEKCWQD